MDNRPSLSNDEDPGRRPVHGRQLGVDGPHERGTAQPLRSVLPGLPGPGDQRHLRRYAHRRGQLGFRRRRDGRPGLRRVRPGESQRGAGPGQADCSRQRRCRQGCLAPVGKNWIEWMFDGSQAGGTGNLPSGQDLVKTFTCMASLSTSTQAGCGFEHQLESVYAALHGTDVSAMPTENVGFLRDDAFLAVVLVTNEDDASAPPTADHLRRHPGQLHRLWLRGQLQPADALCHPVSEKWHLPVPALRRLGRRSHQRRHDAVRTRSQSRRQRSRQAVRYFALHQLLLEAGEPGRRQGRPRRRDSRRHRRGRVSVNRQALGAGCGRGANRVRHALRRGRAALRRACRSSMHSCQNATNPELSSATRRSVMNTVIRSVRTTRLPRFATTVTRVPCRAWRALIVSKIGMGCVTAALPNVNNPDCFVQDVTDNADGTQTVTSLPACAVAVGVHPCWKVEQKAACSVSSPQGVAVVIDRGGESAPANTLTSFSCVTLDN